MILTIEPEYRDLIPPLKVEEYAMLEASIKAEGCRVPINHWGGVIVDGHNRYQICNKLGLPFGREEIHFSNRDEAKEWIIRNQLARRNISDFQRVELVLKLEPLIAAKAKENQRLSDGKGCQISDNLKMTPIDTKKELARAANVSHETIRLVKKIKESPVKELARMTRDGAVSITAASAVATLPEAEQIEVVKAGPQAVKDKAKLLRHSVTRASRTTCISIGPAKLKEMHELAKQIHTMCQKPSSQVSLVELRSKTAALCEAFSKLAEN